MSSTRTAARTTPLNKLSSGNTHQINGSVTPYDSNDSSTPMNFPSNSKLEFDGTSSRSSLTKNVSQYDGLYRNARFIHAISSGLLGQQVIVQTSDRERFHGVLETFSPNGDVVLTVSHRLDTNNNDLLAVANLPMDLMDTIDTSVQTFELHKRIIKASTIVEIIAVDIDLSGSGKCLLDDNPKANQFESDRFSRMEHFYGSEDIDPETLEELELGDDGKAGFDVEDMFQTNKQKFQTTTDYDESKYTNVPVPELSEVERAEIERKAMEIETGKRSDEIDEDDAGVKRPTEYQSNDGNSHTKTNRPYRSGYGHDHEYNSSGNRRGNSRDQRLGNNTNIRRGTGGNYSKPNQYISSRSSDQSAYNSQSQYHPRGNRGARFTENRPSYEGQKLSPQSNNDETHRHQRADSNSYSHGQVSGPPSPSTAAPTRTIYPSNNRSSANRNSPAPYTGSSSSCNNSIPTTSPPSSNQTSNNNKTVKKSSRIDQQSLHDDSDKVRPAHSSNNAPTNNTMNRPSQLQPKQSATLSTIHLSGQEDLSNTHETINTTQTDSNPSYASSTGAITPNSMKLNPLLNPDAVEFIPGVSRENDSRPESRGASTTSPLAMHSYLNHAQAAALHLLQQQQVQSPQTASTAATMVPPTHATNPAAFYQQYFQPPFANMPHFINATPQQIGLGMMPASMLSTQALIANQMNTPNTNNGSSSGMTTPNSSASGGPTGKTHSNPLQSSDNGNAAPNNVATKKATVSVQRPDQSNLTSQQQQPQAQSTQVPPQMLYSTHPIRYFSPDYMTQSGATQSMQIQQVPMYFPINTSGLIQTGTVGQPQNIMIPTVTSSAGVANQAPSSLYYASVYGDPRVYSLYSTAAAAGVTPHWQLARSPPQQQQPPVDQQRTYSGGQNMSSQQNPSSGVPNANSNNSRTTSAIGSNNGGTNAPQIAPQYSINGAMPAAYAYGPTATWLPGPQQMASPQNSMSPQVNAAYSIIFDPTQQPIPSPQGAYVHQNSHEAANYYMQQQQSQQTSTQQNLDSAAAHSNYSR